MEVNNATSGKLSARSFVKNVFADVINNISTAIYLTRTVIVAEAVLFFGAMLVGLDFADKKAMGAAMGGANIGIYLLVMMLVLIYPISSAAVSWHRFVVRGEMTTKLLNNPGVCFKYFGYGIVIFLIMLIPIIVMGIVAGILSAAGPVGGVLMIIFGIFAFFFLIILSYRLSPKLPSIALDATPLTLKESYNITKGSSWFFVRFFILLFLICLGIGIVFGVSEVAIKYLLPAIFGAKLGVFITGFLGLILQIVQSWFNTMLQISILTNLYKLFVRRNI